MTSRNYATIAECIRDELERSYIDLDTEGYRTLYSLHKRLLDVFKADNPRFDREKFERACGF